MVRWKRKKRKRGTGMQPLKDRNVSGERYLAPPNGQICKLVSGVSLYGKTPRLEGRGGWRDRRGAVLLPTYCDVVYMIVHRLCA